MQEVDRRGDGRPAATSLLQLQAGTTTPLTSGLPFTSRKRIGVASFVGASA